MLPDHKWEVDVRSGSYYPAMCHSFGGNDFGFSCDDEAGMAFFAYSYHIDALDDPGAVARRLFSLELLLNGALRLEAGAFNIMPTTFPRFALVDGGAAHAVDPSTFEEYPFDNNPAIDAEALSFGNRVATKLVKLSKDDEAIRTILFLVGMVRVSSPLDKVMSWGTLYRILDTVKHYCGEEKLTCKTLKDKRVKEFTAAVNNMSILGLNARHGAAGNAPPANVISDLDTASELIMEIACEFMEEYLKAKGW